MHGVGKGNTEEESNAVKSSFTEIFTDQLGNKVVVILPGYNSFHRRILWINI
jgi:hypothetical protein